MRIALISSGLEVKNIRLQPFSYLVSIVEALQTMGHEVVLFSNRTAREGKEDNLLGIQTIRLNLFTERMKMVRLISSMELDLVLLHTGATSFLHIGNFVKKIKTPVVAIFTSPIYQKKELLRLGIRILIREYKMTLSPLLSLLVPNKVMSDLIKDESIKLIITESRTTKIALTNKGVPAKAISVIKPAISKDWLNQVITETTRISFRKNLGFGRRDIVVCFFGPPPFLRGLPSLIKAVCEARKQNSNINLLILSRERRGEFDRESKLLHNTLDCLSNPYWVKVVSGFLNTEQLIGYISSCDIVALPFELVPSDVPLSILEAMALGLPVITTQVSCLPEMVPEGKGICIPASNINALSNAILHLAKKTTLRHYFGRMGRQFITEWLEFETRDTKLLSSLRSITVKS